MASERDNIGSQPERIVGQKFHPSDEQLIERYVDGKNAGDVSVDAAINEVKICDYEPWELEGKAKIRIRSEEDRIFHFFSKPDLKFPNSQRSKPITKRATKSGCWKPTGVDRVIRKNGKKIGIKKLLAFYGRKQPRNQRSNWFMYEYHSAAVSPKGAPYVVCKVKFREGDNASMNSSPNWEVSQKSKPAVPSREDNNASMNSSPNWEVGQTSNSAAPSSPQIELQNLNPETDQPAEDQSIKDHYDEEMWAEEQSIKDHYDKTWWKEVTQMNGVDSDSDGGDRDKSLDPADG